MANVKITDLAVYTNPDSTDVLPIVDVGADVTKKISIADLLENAGSGTAAAPGIAFDGDSNTGIYRPGADQLAISTGGTGRLFVDASGRLLAGSSVAGDGDADNLNLADATNPGITLRGSSSGVGSIYFADGTTGDDLKRGQIRYSHNDNALVFATNATEKGRLDSSGYLRLAGAGIQFNGDTAAANALDDYEEGTFTPELSFGSSTTGITYTARAGFYVKVGKVVHAWVYINLSSKGSATGAAAVSQFPFTSEDINVSGLGNWPGAQPSRRQNESSSNFALTMVDNSINCAITNGAGVSVTNATFTDGTILEFALCYRAA